jgi:signal transduction histidine kinase
MTEKPLSFEDLQRELQARLYRFGLKLRVVVAPIPLLVGGFVFVTDDSLWRRIVLATTLGLAIALMTFYALHKRTLRQIDFEAVLMLIGVLFHPMVLFATGGIASPVLIAMLMVCFIASTVLARRASGFILAAQLACIGVAATLEYFRPFGTLVPKVFRGAVHSGPATALLCIYSLVAMFLFVVTREIGTRIQSAFSEVLENLVVARERSLQLYRDQLADLTLLSGEIAHELKNPLASVKGLAALLARRHSGEPEEPLAVLRREVDRMQRILEEFLNFSRPLVPLNLEQVDLVALTREVITMHEGLSEMHQVSIELASPRAAEARCDGRKVRQILVNLIQNALEASEEAGHVLVRVDAADSTATISIEDAGIGLAPGVATRVFEAGVTTKAAGSGLGLSVARGLARQHGGDVVLNARSPRGCIATLRLPLAASVEPVQPVSGARQDYA